MAKAGSVEVDIRANSAQFVREMRRVRRSTEGVQRQLRTFSNVARGAFAIFGVTGGISLARNVLQTANTLDDFSRRIGVSAQQLQAWQQVALESGIASNQFNLAIQRVTRRSAEAAKGLGEAQEALRILGIDARAFTQLTLDQQILDLSTAFEAVEDDAERLRLAFKLFDTEGTAVLQFFNQGTEAIRQLRDETSAWDDETREALADANTEIAIWLNNAVIAFGNVLGAAREFFGFIRERGGFGLMAPPTGAAAAGGGRSFAPALGEQRSLATGTTSLVAARARLPGIFGTPGFAAGLQNPPLPPELERRQLGEGQMTSQLDAQVKAFREMIDLQQEQLRLVSESEDAFVNLFTKNMIQAADSGFDAVLDSWRRTLVQMALEALNSQLFRLLAGTGFGQSIFGGLGLPGFGNNTAAALADQATRGPG